MFNAGDLPPLRPFVGCLLFVAMLAVIGLYELVSWVCRHLSWRCIMAQPFTRPLPRIEKQELKAVGL